MAVHARRGDPPEKSRKREKTVREKDDEPRLNLELFLSREDPSSLRSLTASQRNTEKIEKKGLCKPRILLRENCSPLGDKKRQTCTGR